MLLWTNFSLLTTLPLLFYSSPEYRLILLFVWTFCFVYFINFYRESIDVHVSLFPPHISFSPTFLNFLFLNFSDSSVIFQTIIYLHHFLFVLVGFCTSFSRNLSYNCSFNYFRFLFIISWNIEHRGNILTKNVFVILKQFIRSIQKLV